MRMVISLVIALVVVSALANRGAAVQQVAAGTVVEFKAGQLMAVVNESLDVPLSLRESTVYERRIPACIANPAALRTGAQVIVWYRGVGERRPVADKVCVRREAPHGAR